jgi:hypothetical protein
MLDTYLKYVAIESMINTSQSMPDNPYGGRPQPQFQAALNQVSEVFGGTAAVVMTRLHSPEVPNSYQNLEPNDRVLIPPAEVIAVQCGAATQGLCAISFASRRLIEEFLSANTCFERSLITVWPQSTYALWLRSDWLPPNTSWDGVCWHSDSTIPVLAPGLALSRFVFRAGPVIAVPFVDIKWSTGLSDRFRIILLQQAFGSPHGRSASGKVIINKMFWGHFLAEKLALIFHLRLQSFLRRTPQNPVAERIGPDELMRLMLCEMQQTAAQHLPDFPMDAITLPILKRINEVMKIVTGVNTPGEREDFSAFLEACVAERSGSSLAIGELYLGYAKARRSSGQEPYPEPVFQKLIPELVYERFRRRKSHDLVRLDDGGGTPLPPWVPRLGVEDLGCSLLIIYEEPRYQKLDAQPRQ